MPNTETYPIQEFLNYLTFQKRYSKHTIISYKNDLTVFFDFVFLEYKISEINEITASIVRTWLASLKENKASSKTINRKISSLKSFFKYQLKLNKITVSPVATISSLKVSRRLPSFIEQKDIDTLLTHNYFSEDFEGKTNSLIFEILYQTGIRRSELINLKEKDIDPNSSNIKVLGKGNKERIVPVNNRLLKIIDGYIAEKKDTFSGLSTDFLLVSKKGKALNPKYVYNIVKNNLAKVSTNQRKSPHVLRHSFATHLTNNGAQINAIKELLGHSSLAATQIYTHNSIEKLKEVHKQAHPKS
ncbi:MAG: tyrosine-type recombinase/integrase [Bacteroidota bacterium]|nr:tyrosine-type recombinase/integrase [Bacteroidota bacterium]